MNVIKGNTSPKAEEKNFYEISSMFEFGTSLFAKQPVEKYIWTLFKKDKTLGWKQVSNNIKYGEKVPYIFGEKVVGIPYKIEVHKEGKNLMNVTEKKLIANLIVTPRSFKEPVIGRVILLNRGNANINKAKFNESLSAEARTANLFGKEITFYLWEEGASESEKYKKPKTARVDKNGIAKVQFSLMDYATQPTLVSFFTRNSNATKKFFVTAQYENKTISNKESVEVSNSSTPTTTTPKTTTQPESTVYSIIQNTTDVVADGLGKIGDFIVDQVKSTTQVNPQPSGQKQEDRECPRCKKVTIEELQKIFTAVKNPSDLEEIVKHFNNGAKYFGIDTCLKKAHFFAQVLKETGSSLTIKSPESMNYSTDALKNGYWYSEGTNWVKGNLNTKKGGYFANGSKKKSCNLSYFRSNPDVAEKYGRKDLNSYRDKGVQAANEDMLANYAYSNKYGNGSVESGDGSKYRGKGLIQLTWKENYEKVNNEIKHFDPSVDIVSSPKDILTDKKYAVYSAMGFWKWKKISDVIKKDKSPEIVDKVTYLINKEDDEESKKKRKSNFQNITSKVFRIDECEPGVVQPKTTKPSGKWHNPVDNPRRTKYNSSGNIKPVNGAYGDVRDSYTKYHSGLDLFALPYIKDEFEGTPVYACLDGDVVESTPGNSAGQTIRIKIENVKDLLEQEKKVNYQLEFTKGEEKGIDIKETDDVYLIYMHLSKRVVQSGKVTAGTLIGYSGVSGSIASNIPSPHLHLEIATVQNAYGTKKAKRTNPARFIKLNSYDTKDQDDAVNYKYKQDGTKTKWNPQKADQRGL
ncbi:peptidoglycan DD-metalloendopeptidase family protein [Epilithonimonas ginsengisoli]|uniref:Peptidoglycan DD-metalloendopeptidase family protein n=1 Tax=Epilithonimonas ginsengisoli TaxID=1245592 RepID=A0ABU4JDJ6_9FLAO|nr:MULTISPECIES: peptidoglycan DD-metalloendopeptidase family protein [Chryseobacterium group]MBV6878693.1 peptidoglycan DD-metalloendopeptidase family protein [Epilithonimonas sp. FP105]MDW8547719.1 peptidoglycan DD-metalloendopeptidase family protein [Epilithonimonas ginsengisoli]OAH75943.1 hypothetical protein AXA65_02370 [Chryseobacterium sp. FP211-J200]